MIWRITQLLALAILLVGCGTAPETPSSTPVSSDMPRLTPGPTATAGPRGAIPPGPPGLTPHSIVRVSSETPLEIHSGPGSDYPVLLPAEWKQTATGTKATTHDALATEDLLGLEGGALQTDGQDWYLVTPFAPGARYNAWVDPTDPTVGLDGWVPAVGTDVPRLMQEGSPDPPALALNGVGDADLSLVASLERAGLIWYAAAPTPSQDCHFKITLPASDEVLVEDHVRGWGKGTAVWPKVPMGARIETTCAWAIDVRDNLQ